MNSASVMISWYERAQVDYVNKYMALYASFNAWYRDQTGTQNDRQALNHLRRGNTLWTEYCEGITLHGMVHYMRMLVEYTQREPLSYATPHWRGEVADTRDWVSLIEYWYRVRCLVMHGAVIQAPYVYLAYETLNIFMTEIIHRSQSST